jgi:hypothetical protein
MSERRVAVKWEMDLRRIARCTASMNALRGVQGVAALGYEIKKCMTGLGGFFGFIIFGLDIIQITCRRRKECGRVAGALVATFAAG